MRKEVMNQDQAAAERNKAADKLWGALMDWCRARCVHPSDYSDLFSIVAVIRSGEE